MIVLQLAAVKRIKTERPEHYPYCQGETFQRWGQTKRKLKDTKIRTV